MLTDCLQRLLLPSFCINAWPRSLKIVTTLLFTNIPIELKVQDMVMNGTGGGRHEELGLKEKTRLKIEGRRHTYQDTSLDGCHPSQGEVWNKHYRHHRREKHTVEGKCGFYLTTRDTHSPAFALSQHDKQTFIS